MLARVSFLFCFILAAACSSGSINSVASKQLIEYQSDENSYVVVVPQDESLSLSEAKRIARQRAAEMTVDKGYRYFAIESEGEVQVLKTNRDGPSSQDFPTNMYNELIIENNFGKDSLQRKFPPTSTFSSGYRIVFRIQTDGSSRGSIDACTLTDCNP